MEGFRRSRCPNDRIESPDMTGYLKLAPVAPSWQKVKLKDISISQSFEELQSLNSESKLITPKYLTCTYLSYMVAILDFCDLGVGP